MWRYADKTTIPVDTQQKEYMTNLKHHREVTYSGVAGMYAFT